MLKSKSFKTGLLVFTIGVIVSCIVYFFIYQHLKSSELLVISLILFLLFILIFAVVIIAFSVYNYYLRNEDKEMEEKEIYLAGGCFWGVQEFYKRLKGVEQTVVGYGQGNTVNPSYEEVTSQTTNHTETVHIIYNAKQISLNKILEYFFTIIDPTTLNRQKNDIGTNYRTGIYYTDQNDLATINNFIAKKQANYSKKIVVEVQKLNSFYDAEEYHQNYLVKNPTGYCHVTFNNIKETDLKPEYLK